MLGRRLDSNLFNLCVMGEFKRGKSSLINALIGADVAPVGVVPLTAIATVLEYGEARAVRVLFRDGSERQAELSELWGFATEKGNPNNQKGVAEVRITWPSAWLKSGVRLIDTPGIGSVYQHNAAVTYELLPRADAVLLVLSVDQPVGQAEYDFLKQVKEYAGRVFILLNKADLLGQHELDESQAFAAKVIAEAMQRPKTLFPVSARLALEARRSGSLERLAQSRLPAFNEELERFLREGKNSALLGSLAKGLLRLIAQTRLNAELALSSLAAPAEELRRKLAAFEHKRDEAAQERRDFGILLREEVRRLADQDMAAAVEAFTTQLCGEIEPAITARFNAVRHLAPRELDEELRRYAMEQVRLRWDHFRQHESTKLEAAFQGICDRLSDRIDTTVDAIFRFSSELFAVPYEAVEAQSAWSVQSGFLYKFWEAPGSIRLVTRSFLHSLPKCLADRWILGAARGYARELADTQAGRVRYDFAQRLDASMRAFAKAMSERLDSALALIETAVSTGLELSTESAAAADAEARRLTARLDALATLAAQAETLSRASESDQDARALRSSRPTG